MVELRILGSPGLLGADGGQLLSVLHRPKRLALLSYMGVECLDTYQRRDKLLGLFWPDSEESKARSSLSEALSSLRQSLGTDAVLTRGQEEIALSSEALWCDAAAFRRAAREDNLTEVVRLYRGPLLDGFFLDGPRSFENWLDSTRAQMERIVLEALGTLTDAAAASGDASSLTWAERAVTLRPTDGPSVRRLVTLQAHSGHRTGALDAFEHYVQRLKDERGIAPSQDLVELASRIESGDLLEEPAPARPGARSPPTSPRATLRLVSGGPEASDPAELHPAAEPATPLAEPDVATGDRPAAGVRPAPGLWNRLTLAFAAAIVALASLAAWSLLRPVDSLPVVHAEITPFVGTGLIERPGRVGFDVSPDGRHIVYVGEAVSGRQLWTRPLDAMDPIPIPGTEGADSPVFSPDGSSVLFVQGGTLKTVSLAGGIPFTVVSGLTDPPHPEWGSDGQVYYSSGSTIHRVPATGGEPQPVTTEVEGTTARFPHVLPDGRGVLVTLRRDGYTYSVGVVGPDGGDVQELFRGTSARYTASGHIVYVARGGALMAAPFDLDQLRVTGSPATLVEGVPVQLMSAAASWTLSETGTVVYLTTAVPASYHLVWVDRSGIVTEIDSEWTFGGSSRWSSLALSPGGERLAVSRTTPPTGVDLWIKQLDRGPAERFTFNGQGNHRPTWSPDGEHLAYVRAPSQGTWELGRRRADGTGEIGTLVEGPAGTADYSRDGQWLVYSKQAASSDIFALRVGVDTVGRTLVATRYHEWSPRLSPSGRWLAYNSDETGRNEVYVRSFPDVDSMKKQVSTSGGTEAVWSHSGRELFFRDGAGELIAVEVIDDAGFSAGTQTRLFSASGFLASATHPIYDVRPDDQAFVMIREAIAGQPPKLMLAQNLFAN